jgi:hypothetical protein
VVDDAAEGLLALFGNPAVPTPVRKEISLFTLQMNVINPSNSTTYLLINSGFIFHCCC